MKVNDIFWIIYWVFVILGGVIGGLFGHYVLGDRYRHLRDLDTGAEFTEWIPEGTCIGITAGSLVSAIVTVKVIFPHLEKIRKIEELYEDE